MNNDKQALNLFKTYMVLGPDYRHGRQPKLVFPQSITHMIMQYAQYEDWMKTAHDLAALLKRDDLNFIWRSESWEQGESLNDSKKWLANPDEPLIIESYEFYQQSIMPLIKFIAKSPLVDEFSWNVLMFAAWNGHTEALKALLSVPGMNVNAVEQDSWTALMCAAFHGHTEALKVLLAMPDIDVNAKSTSGQSALMLAARNNKTEAVRLIAEHCAQEERHNQGKPTFN